LSIFFDKQQKCVIIIHMITIDELLLDIVNNTNPTVEDLMSARDSRVLRSLATSVNSHYFDYSSTLSPDISYHQTDVEVQRFDS